MEQRPRKQERDGKRTRGTQGNSERNWRLGGQGRPRQGEAKGELDVGGLGGQLWHFSFLGQ
jgi:hypothetical protein